MDPDGAAADDNEVIEQTKDFALTPWGESFLFPKFDPAKGILQDVTITARTSIRATITVENTSPGAITDGTITVLTTVGFQENPTAGFPPIQANASAVAQPITLASGETGVYDGLTGSDEVTVTVSDPAQVSEFILTDPAVPNVVFDANATGSFDAQGDTANADIILQNEANAAMVLTYRFLVPAIDVEKATNGEDADEPTGPQLPVGSEVTWTYVVTNSGEVGLFDVALEDDQLGPITCPMDTLAAGEAMSCEATGTAEEGQHTNVATVIGTYDDSGNQVDDSDPSHYIGVVSTPAIALEKLVNGQDADDPPGVELAVGDPVTFSFEVTNTGAVGLENVTLTDDVLGPITCPMDTLAVGETMTCETSGTAEEGQHTNVGTVVGTSVVDGTEVSATDPANYNATPVPPPAIDIEKFVDGQDADDPPGIEVLPGQIVTYTFDVTNTGSVDLQNVTVVDDVFGPIACPTDVLGVGEMMRCSTTAPATEGQHRNEATTEGESVLDGQIVTDTDLAYHITQSAPPPAPTPTPAPAPPPPPHKPELPKTGGETAPIAAVGIALLVVGGLALLSSRRIRAALPIFGRDTPWDWAQERRRR